MIYLASDHAGFERKEQVKKFLLEKGMEVSDVGPEKFDKMDDYPDFVIPCAEKVAGEKGSFGVVFGHSGQGEAFAANKVRGIRAVVYYGHEDEIIELSRVHNDANVLSVGAHFVNEDAAKKAVEKWLGTAFTNEERHVRRIKKVADYENKKS
ncbi:MAG: RpiB/LacA/LacB family sugar-phosphate isomerase [Candidatus Gracilibacteria bacterium]